MLSYPLHHKFPSAFLLCWWWETFIPFHYFPTMLDSHTLWLILRPYLMVDSSQIFLLFLSAIMPSLILFHDLDCCTCLERLPYCWFHIGKGWIKTASLQTCFPHSPVRVVLLPLLPSCHLLTFVNWASNITCKKPQVLQIFFFRLIPLPLSFNKLVLFYSASPFVMLLYLDSIACPSR